MAEIFILTIGAKRQVTFPARLLELLALKEGNEVEISVGQGTATLVPMVSVPRNLVPSALLARMEARRGAKNTDMSLSEFNTIYAPPFVTGKNQRTGNQVPGAPVRRKVSRPRRTKVTA